MPKKDWSKDPRTKAERIYTAKAYNSTKEQRRSSARTLMVARKKLSNGEQLERLDWRLGVGVGAKKERARLSVKVDWSVVSN